MLTVLLQALTHLNLRAAFDLDNAWLIQAISSLQKLKFLDMRRIPVDDGSYAHLLAGLFHLEYFKCDWVPSHQTYRLMTYEYCPNSKESSVLVRMTDAGLYKRASCYKIIRWQQLQIVTSDINPMKELHLGAASGLTTLAFKNVYFIHLESLKINDAKVVTDDAFDKF